MLCCVCGVRIQLMITYLLLSWSSSTVSISIVMMFPTTSVLEIKWSSINTSLKPPASSSISHFTPAPGTRIHCSLGLIIEQTILKVTTSLISTHWRAQAVWSGHSLHTWTKGKQIIENANELLAEHFDTKEPIETRQEWDKDEEFVPGPYVKGWQPTNDSN